MGIRNSKKSVFNRFFICRPDSTRDRKSSQNGKVSAHRDVSFSALIYFISMVCIIKILIESHSKGIK